MKYEKLTKHEALIKAQALLGITAEINPVEESLHRVKQEQNLNLNDIFIKLRQSLHRSKNALAYLQERKLNPKLEIGYDNYAGEGRSMDKQSN
jgi:hypothetical protein